MSTIWTKLAAWIIIIGVALGAEISPPYSSIKEMKARSAREDAKVEKKDSASDYPADQPVFNPAEDQGPNSGLAYPQPVAPPPQENIPNYSQDYAPNFNYDPNYTQGNYGYAPAPYYPEEPEPYPSPISLLWSTVPDARTIVNYMGRGIGYIFSSLLVVAFGALLTIATCSFTEICSIQYNGVRMGPIREEMRSLMTNEKINNAAEFVKNAINKYQTMQKVFKKSNTKQN